MSKAYSAIRHAMRSQLWAIQPEKLEAIMAFLQLKAEGKAVEAETLAGIQGQSAVTAARAQKVSSSSKGAVAVLPLYGLILHRGSAMGDISGPTATSTAKFLQQFRQAVNDPNVQAIVIDVDSPGGTVEGVDELASEIRGARSKKQVIAVSNCLCASAAYYIAASCSEVVVSPSSLTGSVGVYCAHEDDSKMLEDIGVKVTLISFGENKTAGNNYEPLSDTARADLQNMVNSFGEMFEKAVASGRKISQAKVHQSFGQGKVFTAKDAVSIGMADSIGTFDSVLARFGVKMDPSSMSMEADGKFAQAHTIVPQLGAAKADDSSGSVDCTCTCDSCEGGDCDGCTHDGCDCDGCTCDMAAKATKAKADTATTRLRLQLTAAK
jgi:signal peptide peptidase SppA